MYIVIGRPGCPYSERAAELAQGGQIILHDEVERVRNGLNSAIAQMDSGLLKSVFWRLGVMETYKLKFSEYDKWHTVPFVFRADGRDLTFIGGCRELEADIQR